MSAIGLPPRPRNRGRQRRDLVRSVPGSNVKHMLMCGTVSGGNRARLPRYGLFVTQTPHDVAVSEGALDPVMLIDICHHPESGRAIAVGVAEVSRPHGR